MDEKQEFKDAVWEAIENVYYEFNGKRGTHFLRKELEEAINDHKRFFEEAEDDFDEDDIYYDPDDEF